MFEWDVVYEPPLQKGKTAWIVAKLDARSEFTDKICQASFHAMRAIESFDWRISFPPSRPAKRWWVTADYYPDRPNGFVLEEHHGETCEINWLRRDLLRGVLYFLNWEW